MPTIDERVVAMAFENAKFEQAIAQTMRTLDNLNKALAQVGASSGFDKIEGAANKVTLNGPMSALDKLKAKFGRSVDTKPLTDLEGAGNKVTLNGAQTALDRLKQKLSFVGSGNELGSLQQQSDRVDLSNINNEVGKVKQNFDAMRFAAIVAFGTIVHRATNASFNLAKSLTVQPLIDGFHEYETQINSIQTIQANTGLSGKKGMDQIKGALNDLNHYADKTIYNFSEMAKNIGTFTAAGVDLKTATGSIKGIANIAAASGSSSQQASTAMYQLSQAIAAGRVSLQDWNSVVNAGMGGTLFQKALINTGIAMGKVDGKTVKMGKNVKIAGESFRESVSAKPGQKSWLDSDVLTTTLQTFTGDMTEAQLKAKGFNDEQIRTIQTQSKMAVEAATKIKTFSQMMSALKEAVGSAWGGVFKTIFGDIGQAKSLFTPLYNTLAKLLTGPINGFTKALQSWAKLGGRKMFLSALSTAFKSLGSILGAVRDAFRDIFPAATGKSLLEMTRHFANFANAIKVSQPTLDNLRATFRGFFAVLDIGWQIVKKAVGVIFDLLGVAKGGAGGFLAFTGGIANFFVAVDTAIKKGHALDGFFNGLSAILRIPLHILGLIANAFFGLFGGLDQSKASGVAGALGTVNDGLKPMNSLVDKVKKGWEDLVHFFEQLKAKVGPAVHQALEPIIHIGDTITNAFKNIDADKAASIIQTALLGGIFVTLKKALTGGVSVTIGKLDGLNKVMGALTGNLKALQRGVQAAVLLEIATAILALAAGVGILSRINPEALDRAMSAVAIGLGQLVGAVFLLSKATTGAGFAAMPLLAAALVGLATAVTILAAAVKIFSTMSWEELTRGLAGVGGALLAIGVGMKAIGVVRLTAMAPGLIAVALALNLLAVAMKQFGGLSWDEIVKGMVGMGGGLLAVGFALQSFGPSTLLIGPGLVIVALAMTMLAGAVGAFGSLRWDTLGKGLAGVTASLLLIGAALWEMPPGPLLAGQAAGLVILSVALGGITAAVKVLGGMSVVGIAKGLIALGGALFELAVGLDIMTASAPGAVALLAVSAALALLAPTLAFMGTLKWGTIFKGLAAIAASLLTLSLIGSIASTGLLTLGIALTAMAAAVLIAGTGIFLLGKGLSSLSETGSRAIGVMIAAMTAFILALPGMIIAFIKGLVETIGEVAKIAPQVVDSLVKIVNSLLDVLIKAAPKVQELIQTLMEMFIRVVNDNSARFIEAGWKLLENFLSGIANHITSVTNKAATIVIRFLGALTARMPALVAAGARFIIAFLTGVGDHMEAVLAAGARIIHKFLVGIAKAIPGIVGGVGRIIVAFITAVGNQIPKIMRAGVHLAKKFIHAVAKALLALASVGAAAVIAFMNKLAEVIEKNARAFVKAGFRIGAAIAKGLIEGMGDLRKEASDKLGEAVFHKGRKEEQDTRKQAQQFHDQGMTRTIALGLFDRDLVDEIWGKPKKRTKRRGAKGSRAPTRKVAALDAVGVDPNPKITPVLDLTQVRKQSGDLHTLTRPKSVASVSLAHANAASRATEARRTRAAEQQSRPAPNVTFKQTNLSPRALSEQEIYRRTKSQLAQAKKKLGIHGDVAVIGT